MYIRIKIFGTIWYITLEMPCASCMHATMHAYMYNNYVEFMNDNVA